MIASDNHTTVASLGLIQFCKIIHRPTFATDEGMFPYTLGTPPLPVFYPVNSVIRSSVLHTPFAPGNAFDQTRIMLEGSRAKNM